MRWLDTRSLVLLAGLWCAQISFAQLPNSSAAGYETLLEQNAGPAPAQAQRWELKLKRPVQQGEHVRFSVKVKPGHATPLQFGFGPDETLAITVQPDGRIAAWDRQPIQLSARSGLKPDDWNTYFIDYVVGSDRLLVTAGKDQFTVGAPLPHPPASVDRIFLSAPPSSGENGLAQPQVFAILEPEIAALPIFGEIHWTHRDITPVEPGPRGGISGAGFVAVQKKLYLIGGYLPGGDGTSDEASRSSQSAYSYDPAHDAWTQLPDLPGRREFGQAATRGSWIYFFGGAKQHPYEAKADVYALDTAQSNPHWTTLPSLSRPRAELSGTVIGDQFIVAGGNQYDPAVRGYGPATVQTLAESLDLSSPAATWKSLSPLPNPARGWAASAAVGNKFYLIGGMTFLAPPQAGGKRINQRLASTLRYDLAASQWKALTPPPLPISGASAAVYRERYIILLGGTVLSPLDPIYRWNAQPLVYDTQTDRWLRFRQSTIPPGGVYNVPGAALIDGTIYLAGGEAIHGHDNSLLIGKIQPD